MSNINEKAEKILFEARKFSMDAELEPRRPNSREIVLILHTVPTFEQQLAIQRCITPDAITTPNVRVFGFNGESFKKMTVNLID